jgi:enterochelin esterase-like enzyme
MARLRRFLPSPLPLGLAVALGLATPLWHPHPGVAAGVPVAVNQAETRQTYASALLGQQRRYEVALPPGYADHPERRYPVIVLLHGGSGDQGDWFDPHKGDALATLQTLYRQGVLPPSIVVAPDGNDRRGRSRFWDPQYFDGPNGPMAAALGDELVKVIQSRYRTLLAPRYWALGGLSSGAWGALNIGLKWPNHYAILFSHSGYMLDASGPANSPLATLPNLPAARLRSLRVYLDSGSDDERYRQQSARFHALLDQLGVTNVFHVFPGSHSWRYWREHLADSLRFVGAQWSDLA